ncbi:hypothetical protein BDF19DRAFT_424933 [Syncephalis fuscata]|nr:hypothetical protein BDF19DRAFT_424933 [Syncephalis fuscata]
MGVGAITLCVGAIVGRTVPGVCKVYLGTGEAKAVDKKPARCTKVLTKLSVTKCTTGEVTDGNELSAGSGVVGTGTLD